MPRLQTHILPVEYSRYYDSRPLLQVGALAVAHPPVSSESPVLPSAVGSEGELASPSLTGVARVSTVGGDRWISEFCASNFGSIFFGIVDIVSVVPISGCEILALNCDCGRPGCTST